jgi:hypothetical protein
LEAEEKLFERLAGQEQLPSFEKPREATSDTSQYAEWKPLRLGPVWGPADQLGEHVA